MISKALARHLIAYLPLVISREANFTDAIGRYLHREIQSLVEGEKK